MGGDCTETMLTLFHYRITGRNYTPTLWQLERTDLCQQFLVIIVSSLLSTFHPFGILLAFVNNGMK